MRLGSRPNVAIHIGEPAFPMAAVGDELPFFFIAETQQKLLGFRGSVFGQHATALVLENLLQRLGLDFAAFGELFLSVLARGFSSFSR